MLEEAHKDSLTGFFEREALNPFLEKLKVDALANGKNFSIALIDVDHFKKFNDKFGHAFGDEILKYATSTLRLTFYEGQCFLFRYGGDEFIAVFPDKESKETFQLIRQCHYNLRHRSCLFENKFYRVAISCGIAGFPQDAKTSEELIQKADEAMYFSKRSGRNCTTLFTKIPYLKLQRVLILIGGIILILVAGLLLYNFMLKKIIQPTVSQIRHIKIVTKPGHLDTILLKDGVVMEGRIMTETDDEITVNIYFDKGGEGLMTFKKSQIAEINRAPKAPPEKE